VKEHYFDDVAIQYYVLSGCGIPVNKAYLVHINNGESVNLIWPHPDHLFWPHPFG
jgi:hypothetical protein